MWNVLSRQYILRCLFSVTRLRSRKSLRDGGGTGTHRSPGAYQVCRWRCAQPGPLFAKSGVVSAHRKTAGVRVKAVTFHLARRSWKRFPLLRCSCLPWWHLPPPHRVSPSDSHLPLQRPVLVGREQVASCSPSLPSRAWPPGRSIVREPILAPYTPSLFPTHFSHQRRLGLKENHDAVAFSSNTLTFSQIIYSSLKRITRHRCLPV